jgi:hypothetical protein
LMDRKGRANCVAPSFSWSYDLGLLSLGYVKDQMNRQRVTTLDELKAQITAAIANVTKDMLQCI